VLVKTMKTKTCITLDRFLEGEFYADDLANRAATKPELDRADELLLQRETELFSALNLDTNSPEGSDQFNEKNVC
jgi:hypothetical protein